MPFTTLKTDQKHPISQKTQRIRHILTDLNPQFRKSAERSSVPEKNKIIKELRTAVSNGFNRYVAARFYVFFTYTATYRFISNYKRAHKHPARHIFKKLPDVRSLFMAF